MTRPMIKIHNVITDEIIEREMNDEELKSYLATKEVTETWSSNLDKKLENRQKALAKLAALGLTEEEIAAL